MAELFIKPEPEPEPASPVPIDDDIYEDAGDLEFNSDPAFSKLYLARVPRYVWEAWSKLDEDAEIQIGTIRMERKPNPDGSEATGLSMLLNNNVAQHQLIPKEYQLDVTAETVANTFVFTEKDLPGFKSRSRTAFNSATANMPVKLLRPKNDKVIAKQPYDPNKRNQPYYRKAIPKRTTLAGRVAHELNCIPVETVDSQRLLAQRTLDAMKPKKFTKFINDSTSTVGQGFIQPGSIGAYNTFGGFIKTKTGQAGQKVQTQKTARMPENELLDRMFACFRKYRYWSMKALRAELQQPEAYLRETLEKIAVLAKSGRFATQWSLKQELQPEDNITEETSAPTMGGDAADDTDGEMEGLGLDDEDEDIKFEDVS